MKTVIVLVVRVKGYRYHVVDRLDRHLYSPMGNQRTIHP